MTSRRLLEFAISIAVGNAIYYLLLFPEVRHQPLHVDAGLLVDFACCVLVYVAIRLGVARARKLNARTDAWRRRN
jgi:uncharacterized membrane protein